MESMNVQKSKKIKPKKKNQYNATDVGLEPTASALGGLRATIAPTGRVYYQDIVQLCILGTLN